MRILHVDERRATEPGSGVHWTTDLIVHAVAALPGVQELEGALGIASAQVALVEISDQPSASVVPMVERLRSHGLPTAIRIHRTVTPEGKGAPKGMGSHVGSGASPLGSHLEAAIESSDLAFFRGRGELVRIASQLTVAPDKARLVPSPVRLPAMLSGTQGGGILGIGFPEGELPRDVTRVTSAASLHRDVQACAAVALGPLMGPGYPALTHGLLARGIAVVGSAAQAALDGFPPPGWLPVPSGAAREDWSTALAELRPFESHGQGSVDRGADRWLECLAQLSRREVLTHGRG